MKHFSLVYLILSLIVVASCASSRSRRDVRTGEKPVESAVVETEEKPKPPETVPDKDVIEAESVEDDTEEDTGEVNDSESEETSDLEDTEEDEDSYDDEDVSEARKGLDKKVEGSR